jgi:hypothetical protein
MRERLLDAAQVEHPHTYVFESPGCAAPVGAVFQR